MPNPEQAVPLDFMIKRLEAANARAYEKVERVSVSEQDAASEPGRHASDQRKPPAVPNRPSSRSGPISLALIGLLLVASVCVAAFAWQSSFELAQRVQTMERDLANMEQQVERLKTGQEQTARNNTTDVEHLKAALSQMARDKAALAEQLKANQEQLAAVMSDRNVGSARKPLRQRKPVQLLNPQVTER
jgi:uncharacterized protein HemX